MKRKFMKGFTLTELMAVVIILSLLSGIAAGTYKKAVERTRVSDGLTAASNVMGALERYLWEHPDIRLGNTANAITLPTKDKLDISFPNQQDCANDSNYCFKTKYFETVYLPDGKVMAARSTGDYTIIVYSSVIGTDLRKDPECIGNTLQGRKLCVSAGYVDCTGNVCNRL